MVMVIGEPDLAREVVSALAIRGIDAAQPTNLEEIPHKGVVVLAEGASRNDEDLERACRAIVIGGGTLVWVTARAPSDRGIQDLQRKGIPYTVLRTGAIVFLPERFDGHFVLVPADIAPAPIALPFDLARATAEAIARDDVGTGRIIECSSALDARGWANTLRARGARALVVPRWVASVLGWVGIPRLEVGPDGVAIASRRIRRGPAHLPTVA